MSDSLLFLLALSITIAILAIVMLVLRKIDKNTFVEIDHSKIEWEKLNCPKCNKVMANGLSVAGKGVVWREKSENLPGPFTAVGSVLPNTFNLTHSMATNISWHCNTCSLILIDHSKMLKVKKA